MVESRDPAGEKVRGGEGRGGRKGGREGERERGREGGREGREGGRKGGREGEKEGGREGGREGRREGGREEGGRGREGEGGTSVNEGMSLYSLGFGVCTILLMEYCKPTALHLLPTAI